MGLGWLRFLWAGARETPSTSQGFQSALGDHFARPSDPIASPCRRSGLAARSFCACCAASYPAICRFKRYTNVSQRFPHCFGCGQYLKCIVAVSVFDGKGLFDPLAQHLTGKAVGAQKLLEPFDLRVCAIIENADGNRGSGDFVLGVLQALNAVLHGLVLF